MASLPELKDHVGDNMCLGTEAPEEGPHPGKRGVNIEGLAIKGGRLFFGFRGPAVDGTAKILAVDADALFSGADVSRSCPPSWSGRAGAFVTCMQ